MFITTKLARRDLLVGLCLEPRNHAPPLWRPSCMLAVTAANVYNFLLRRAVSAHSALFPIVLIPHPRIYSENGH